MERWYDRYCVLVFSTHGGFEWATEAASIGNCGMSDAQPNSSLCLMLHWCHVLMRLQMLGSLNHTSAKLSEFQLQVRSIFLGTSILNQCGFKPNQGSAITMLFFMWTVLLAIGFQGLFCIQGHRSITDPIGDLAIQSFQRTVKKFSLEKKVVIGGLTFRCDSSKYVYIWQVKYRERTFTSSTLCLRNFNLQR